MFVASPTHNHDTTTPSEPQYIPEEDQDISSTSAPTPLQRLRIAQRNGLSFSYRTPQIHQELETAIELYTCLSKTTESMSHGATH
jgi:hypothetical protein